MRAGIVAVIALAVVLAACGDTAAPAETAAEVTPAATQAPAPPTATDTPAPAAPARAAAVDFSLPSAQGPQYTLNSFAGQQPVVVVFYRAFW